MAVAVMRVRLSRLQGGLCPATQFEGRYAPIDTVWRYALMPDDTIYLPWPSSDQDYRENFGLREDLLWILPSKFWHLCKKTLRSWGLCCLAGATYRFTAWIHGWGHFTTLTPPPLVANLCPLIQLCLTPSDCYCRAPTSYLPTPQFGKLWTSRIGRNDTVIQVVNHISLASTCPEGCAAITTPYSAWRWCFW